jgi:acyl-coenzyme A synthetase/AMP-(fatty) acid ligase
MTGALPLLAPRDLAAPLAWRQGTVVSAAQFLGEAAVLATQLPARGRPINLCQDRYRFALGLAAALLRGQTSLMPPNALPETLRLLQAGDDGPYALVDDAALDVGGLPSVFVEPPLGATPATTVPLIAADLEAVCLLTSGSTGPPQPHAKRWGPLVANIAAEAERLAELIGLPSMAGLNVVATVPAQHSYGFESTVLLALLGGACFDACRPFYPADIADTLAGVPQPRALVTTPFHLKTLLLAGVELPPVDLVLSATAPLSPQLAAQAENVFGGCLVEIYGCTEAGQVAARRTTAGDTYRTLGALRLWREDGEGGERYFVEGGHVTVPTALADLLVLDDEHHFRLLGRANDLIHVAGKRSSLAHLNFHLNRIEGVDDGAFWMPDEAADGVTRPIAFVVAPTLSAQQVIQALRGPLEAAFVPRRVVHVAALPREATGKLTAQVLARFAHETLQTLQTLPTWQGDAEFDIAADHPAFAGHFPGRPVLPGVVLLSLVMQAVQARPALRAQLGAMPCIEQVKFLQPVGPGTRLRVVLREEGRGVGFEVQRGDTTVARGQLSAGSAGSAP